MNKTAILVIINIKDHKRILPVQVKILSRFLQIFYYERNPSSKQRNFKYVVSYR